MFRKLFAYLFITAILAGNTVLLQAQDFDITVTLNVDALPPDAKDKVKDMKQQLED